MWDSSAVWGLQPLGYVATGMALVLAMTCVWLILDIRRLSHVTLSVEAERAKLAAELDCIERSSARAEAASEAKSRFLATVSHEIRTPLNGVLGMADLMLDTRLDPEQSNYARAIKTSGEALLMLIEEILDFSRIEAGKLDIQMHDVELAPLIEGVIELLAPRAQGKNLEIAAYIDPNLPPRLKTDGARLRQIVMNLAGNAVKFTSTGGVGLRVACQKDALTITIEDTGPGIPATRLEAIFEEFEQADSHAANGHGGTGLGGTGLGGTGLGLAISRRLARLMGGDIQVESRMGEGARFTLTLPMVGGEAGDGQAAKVTAEPTLASLVPQSILIVAAGPFEGHYLQDYFVATGSEVQVVLSTEAAIAAIHQATPDLVIMDAAFGHDPARAVVSASSAAGCRRHLVLLSPFERRSFGAPASVGFDRYLVKPVRRRSLEAQIQDWPGADARQTARIEEEPLHGELLCNRRILIAEDNDINALLAGRLIERLGGRSVRASNGVEALDLLQASTAPGATAFDCVLFDVRMPELDGLDAIRQWRAQEKKAGYPPVPALALTANAFQEDREACIKAGFDGFLAKPLDREVFIKTLEALLPKPRQVA